MIKLEFEVLCKDCEEKLDACIDPYMEKIIVSPCKSCMHDEYERGYDEGRYDPVEE